ncbi:MAG: hypothetical protein VX866_11125 [Pseudomonadota bacterium]|nr:hypothetical protein [Pseudomonadota bacterium]MEC7955817.1 hypothetical protein [Pseudomonadota bacterium]MEC7991352.1 hypothetical protein [Pseudomonadota bacterium]MEC9126625.1 hypothetical protein [Pseudomonadota bacterium]MEC9134551.1 hypothetical protein [Pseudomonadota bacterium]
MGNLVPALVVGGLTAATASMQYRAGKQAARGYALQATQARIEARQMSLQYKKQSVDVMKNILATQATVVARAGAGGIDPFSGNAGTLQNYALATGVNELYTIKDNQVLALAGGELQAKQYLIQGRAARLQANAQALGTLAAGVAMTKQVMPT